MHHKFLIGVEAEFSNTRIFDLLGAKKYAKISYNLVKEKLASYLPPVSTILDPDSKRVDGMFPPAT